MAVGEQQFAVRVDEVRWPFLAEVAGKGNEEFEACLRRRRHIGNQPELRQTCEQRTERVFLVGVADRAVMGEFEPFLFKQPL